ncbi:MAG: tetratricopeptide repeat protein [Schlesneria sp.]|nr:tetratricopeptide repeat protein [Schlesneria sp.]
MTTPVDTPKPWSRHSRLLLVGGLAIIVLTGSVYSYLSFKENRGRANLSLARNVLEKLVFQPDGRESTATADRAEQQLKSVFGTSSERSAQLLIVALARSRGVRVSVRDLDQDTQRCNTADIAVASLLFFKGGELSLADKMAAAAVNRGDERSRALKAATIVSYELGRDEDTARYAAEWSKIEPRDAMPWQYLAYVAEDRGFSNEAVIAFRNQIDCTSGSADESRRRLVFHLIKLGNAAEARKEFDKLQSTSQSVAQESRLLEARLLFLEGKLSETQQILDQTKFTEQERTDATLLRAQILMERSQFDNATTELRDCIARDPANQDAHYLLGQALARSGKPAEAKKQLETHRQLLDLKVRINSLERQAGRQSDNVDARLTLAELYRQLGLMEQSKLWSDSARNAKSSRSR